MRTFAKSQIRYSKSQRMGIFAFLGIILSILLVQFFFYRQKVENSPIEIPNHVLLLDKELEQSSNPASQSNFLQNFDPNELSEEGWRQLGFSQKQVSTIMKYKYSLGGRFSNKEEIKKCFVISEKKFNQIEPYIQFSSIQTFQGNKNVKSPKKRIHYRKFNPNEYSAKDWESIGFSIKQAENILKYKNMLGGKFTSLDQIKKCYMISEEKFQEMKPFIVLPKEKPKPQGTIELIEENSKPESQSQSQSENVGTIEILE